MLYRDAGVNLDALNLIRKKIGQQVTKTFDNKRKSVFGLFGGIYLYDNDYLVSSVDSVGTKILVACGIGVHNTIGQDIVNHCVNDILTTGATPIFFMDYIGFSEIEKNVLVEIVIGLVNACRKEKIILIGGETAQLSRFYPKGVYDLVGFVVGRVKKERLLDPSRIKPGDIMLGLASSGLHTNGYSLARKVLLRKYTFSTHIPELKCTVGEELLKVHLSYRYKLEPLLFYIKAMAHITGGGFYDNIARVLPPGCAAVINRRSWTPLPVFRLIQKLGQVPDEEMYHVFNMGIGMVVIIDPKNLKYFKSLKLKMIGEIIKGKTSVTMN
ncbi:phosphoribosylformylglycinamidine cyclo-ligase [candidate division WOR-3 bacterium RBG_13_43_14]|uniref:Phosphoribosylformylglycinamidine cyclo-ligase n=1 Tax=candidate division WOR-3 bacterium RBG_13_43_14 TaxID=1802590 RepID=A0A1F4UEM8_UNCW3|nr:MAG: phosphoribosylformylglycinamidine cyclo-ligase [candidate division WOR-3 bacterium RBG_13_43_14]